MAAESEWCFNYSWQLGTSTPATTELFICSEIQSCKPKLLHMASGHVFCSTSCAQPQTACGHAQPSAAASEGSENCVLDANSNSTKFSGKPLISHCRPPESIGLVFLYLLIMKPDKEQVNEVLGQKCEWASVRAEMVWCCQVHKEAMEQYTGQGEEVSEPCVTAHGRPVS